MKRLLTAVLIVFILLTMPMAVSAESKVTSMKYTAIVSSDGSCQVTVLITLMLESKLEELEFPVPAAASDVSVNGDRVSTGSSGQTRTVDLSSVVQGLAGQFTFRVDYELEDVIEENEDGQLVMTIPMLSGFAYSIEGLEIEVSMPGNVPGKPAFSSGYHQSSIEQDLEYTIDGAVISCVALKSLKDLETLTMTVNVEPDMFPDAPMELTDAAFDDIMMIVCAALALLYWCIFMRCGPVRRKVGPIPPEGFSAGEMGSVLLQKPADLHLMVFSWAKLGYILIQLDRNSRVLLHKRMEMGNERSLFEQKLFKALFGSGRTVDTTSYRYAALYKKIRQVSPEARSLLNPKSGNPLLFKYAGVGIALFAGISMGIAFGAGSVAQWFWVVVMAAGSLLSGWYIQKWADGLLLQNKRPLWLGLLLSALWILIGILVGQTAVGIILALSQLLVGLMAAFGGRHTKQGRQLQGQVAGLRRYLKTISKEQRKRVTAQDPEYFHNMLPHALALGVDRAFAKRFGKEKIDPCPYLTTGMDGHRSAEEWSELYRRALDAMGLRVRRMPLEKLIRIIESFKKP